MEQWVATQCRVFSAWANNILKGSQKKKKRKREKAKEVHGMSDMFACSKEKFVLFFSFFPHPFPLFLGVWTSFVIFCFLCDFWRLLEICVCSVLSKRVHVWFFVGIFLKKRKKKKKIFFFSFFSPPLLLSVYYKEHAPFIRNLQTDLCDGVILHKLLVALFAGRGAKIPNINEHPKMRPQ